MSLDDKDISSLVRQHATRHAAPDALRASVRMQVALADAKETKDAEGSQRPASVERVRRRWLALGWPAISVSFSLGMLCMALILPVAQRLQLGEPVEADLVAFHVRALKVGPLAEVVSTDRHTVKPWFQGRLDFAPPVFDFAAEGFPLIGGRVEQLRGRAVAALVYAHNRHVVDVFVQPDVAQAPQVAPVRTVRSGFNTMHWSDGSMQYWVVSDFDRGELETFTRLWQERARAQ